ncbi:MAG: hypothetical protein LUH05_05760 [Candidatus Gastranaerophilales bacterium]|nr:hypothetical protein [Candidatus Gastranaerophilales bacterium]
MQTIIKELAINPTIQELMFNADITQIFNQPWSQVLCSGILGALIGGCISGGITWYAMKNTDKIANARWEKSTYKNFECEFWLNFYKEFHIVNRFMKPFLKDIIFSTKQYNMPHMAISTDDNGQEYFENWLKHFNKLFDLVNGYEDLYLPMKNFDKTHIWIIWTMRTILDENKENLIFNESLMLDSGVYKKLYDSFQSLYWDNINKNRDEVTKELEKFWDEKNKAFDPDKLWNYFEEQLNYIENKLKETINGNLFR